MSSQISLNVVYRDPLDMNPIYYLPMTYLILLLLSCVLTCPLRNWKKTVMFSCYLCFASVARTTTRSFSWPFGKTLYPWHYINPFFTVQCPCVDFKTASLNLHTYLWLIRTKRQMSLWSNRPKSTHAKLFCLYLIDVLYSEYFWFIIIIIHLFIE